MNRRSKDPDAAFATESDHGYLKAAIKDALLLRGSADVSDLADYRRFRGSRQASCSRRTDPAWIRTKCDWFATKIMLPALVHITVRLGRRVGCLKSIAFRYFLPLKRTFFVTQRGSLAIPQKRKMWFRTPGYASALPLGRPPLKNRPAISSGSSITLRWTGNGVMGARVESSRPKPPSRPSLSRATSLPNRRAWKRKTNSPWFARPWSNYRSGPAGHSKCTASRT